MKPDFIKNLFFYFTILTVGAAILLVEILGTRVLAPFYGSTVFVWSSLITVTLLALSLGYFTGGKIADMKPDINLLYWFIFFAGLCLLLVPKFSRWALTVTESMGLKFGPLAAAFVLFFLPLFFLATVDPFALKIRARNLDRIGFTAGTLYALTTLGSLIGALVTGFYLISNFPVSQIFHKTSLCLIAIFLIWKILNLEKKGSLKKILSLISALVILLFVLMLPEPDPGFISRKEVIAQYQSFYGDIKVVKEGFYKCIAVGGIIQSCSDEYKRYDASYLKDISQITAIKKPGSMLLMGMGGGTLLSFVPKETLVDVVEIDPKIVEIAAKHDFIPEKEHQLFYDDARHFVRKTDKKYDLVIMDLAKGDVLPFYMLTRESFEEINRIMGQNSVFYINLLLSPEKDSDPFLASVIETLNQVFGKENVHAISGNPEELANINIVVSREEIDWGRKSELSEIDLFRGLTITDDYNPLEAFYLPHLLQITRDRVSGKDILRFNN